MKLCSSFLPRSFNLSPLSPVWFSLSLVWLGLTPFWLVFSPTAAAAQAPGSRLPESRLHGSISEGTSSVLPGSISPRLQHAKDLGAVAPDQSIPGITLVFRRSLTQEADLEQLLAAQQNPSSSRFHHWLTPEDFGRRFGMADADIEATRRWLVRHGFTVTGVSRANDRITFSGTAREVEAAFSTSLHHFQVDGQVHVAPNSDLSLPADLAAITTAVLHLSDFRPHPMARTASHPQYTTADTQAHFLTPPDLAVMYDLPVGSNSLLLGSGQSIAVVGQSYVDLSDYSVVRSFLVTTTTRNLTPVLVPGTGVQAISPQDAGESEIDLEYGAGILNSANFFLVYVGSNPNSSVFDALTFAIDQDLAPVISISYGECETLLSPTDLAQGNALFRQAATQGQTLVAASGDAGSTDCAPVPVSSALSFTQQQALAVSYPASSPYVTAVGGTQMVANTFTEGASLYWAAATPPFDRTGSLLSYVPEIAWNEGSPSLGIFAGGGGASATLPRPSWQAGVPGIPSGATRLLPDVAFQASSANPGFLFCTDDASFLASGQNSNCGGFGETSTTNYPLAGGTSFAAPTFAAMVALLNQTTQSLGQGNLNPVLYGLAGNPAVAPSIFHDITSGSIACLPGARGCSAAGQSGFSANVGYDQATGLGSIDFLHLLAAFPSGQPTLEPTVTSLSAFNTAVAPGDADVISIFVSPVYTASQWTSVSGGVSVAVDGSLVAPALAFATIGSGDHSGRVAYTVDAPATSGSHVIVVTYPGDSTHGPSTATTSILVGNVLASGSVAITAGSVTLPANGTATTTVTVTPSGGYNGRLFWSLSITSNSSSALTACYSIPPLLVQGTSSTTLSLGSGTACSTALPAATTSLRPLAVSATEGNIPTSNTPVNPSRPAPWSYVPAVTSLLLCCLLPSFWRQRRPLPLLCLLLTAGSFAISGCGGSGAGSGGGTPPPIKPVTTYTASLTGRDSVQGAITSVATFTLTAQ